MNSEYILDQIDYGVIVVNRKTMKIIKINEVAKKMFALSEIDSNFNAVLYIRNKFKVNIGDNGYFYFEGETPDTFNRIFEVYTKFVDSSVAEKENTIVALIRDVTNISAQEREWRNRLGLVVYKLKAQTTELKSSLDNDHYKKLDILIKELLSFVESSRQWMTRI